MKRIEKENFEKVELLEKQLSRKLEVYKDLKNSENNESYFNNLYYNTISKMEKENSKTNFFLKPAISYAFIFIISFTVSFQLIDFSSKVSLNDEAYLFSETSLWLEEEDYLSNIFDEDFDLDFESYINSQLNYSSYISLSNDMNLLSENELNEIYENLKNKKIL